MAENYFFDRWDPEGPDYNRTTYSKDSKGGMTPNSKGTYIHYVLDPRRAEGLPYSELYWDRYTGEVVYKDPNTNQLKIYDKRKPAALYLSDDELDEIRESLGAQASAAQQQKELQEKAAKEAATPSAGRLDSITIEPKTTIDSTGKTTTTD